MVLTVTKQLRALGVVGKFVEFFGPGLANLSIADRATISNMSPEMGSTCCFFAPDNKTIHYLRQTGRSEAHIKYIEAYFKAQGFYCDYSSSSNEIIYTQTIELDLTTVVPCLSGPKRPHDQVCRIFFWAELSFFLLKKKLNLAKFGEHTKFWNHILTALLRAAVLNLLK